MWANSARPPGMDARQRVGDAVVASRVATRRTQGARRRAGDTMAKTELRPRREGARRPEAAAAGWRRDDADPPLPGGCEAAAAAAGRSCDDTDPPSPGACEAAALGRRCAGGDPPPAVNVKVNSKFGLSIPCSLLVVLFLTVMSRATIAN
ncbi:unnamed protein product [Urochloa humidicola]